jgi:hypothetical protein
MMVTVLLYAYATGTFSSRRIARQLEDDVAYRVLAAGNFPAHRTIAEFRQQHWAAFEELFVQVVAIARDAGVVQLGALAVDGAKVKAAASQHKAMSYGRMREEARRLREQIATLTGQAEATDAAEDAAHGSDVRGDELPAEWQRREERLAKIAAAKARLEARPAAEDRRKGRTPADGRKSRGSKPFARDFGVPPDEAQDNFTDPESRIMKASHGFDQCYNGQIAVDETTQLIVATGLTNCAADKAELLPLITRAQEPLGGVPPEILAAAGYRGEATFQTLEARGITAYISLGHEVRPAKAPNVAHVATQRMADRLKTTEGRARYRRRKAIVEPVIGWIKEVLGVRRFSLRGMARARGEWNVVCLAVNLRRLHRISLA